jgi:hypothetical protein
MSQTAEITKLPQLYREMRLELRKRARRAAPTVAEQDGKFTATRGALTCSGATSEEAISNLRHAEADARTAAREAKLAERKAAGAAADPDEDDDAEEDDDEDEDGERDADLFDVSFSSETPVERWFGMEVLDHSAGAVDLTRAQGGLAYLVDHNTRDQVGIIEKLRTAGKKLRGTVRFSRSQRAQDIKRDLQDGIRPYTSIGYRVNSFEVTEGKGDAPSTYRATNWTPMEGSTVAVPADCSVGMARAADEKEMFPVSIRSVASSAAPAPASVPQSAAPAAKPAASAPAAIHVEVRTMNPKEVLELTRIASANGIDAKRAEEILSREGITADVASREILAEIGKRNGGQVATPAAENSQKMLELTERENKQFSVCRLLDTYFRNVETGRADNCFELEVSKQIEKDTPSSMRHDGIFIPFTLGIDPAAARRGAALALRTGVATALTAGTATQGKELVFQEPGRFIDFLYNQMRLKALGAETVSGLAGNPVLPKQSGKATGSWVGENPGTDVADSNLTLGTVTMTPKTYQSSTSVSRQLIAQASSANVDIENLQRKDLSTDCALAIDFAGINGTGPTNNQPTGVLSAAGVQAYTLLNDAGNGAKPIWDDFMIMQEYIEDVNADMIGVFSWLTTPGIKSLCKRTPRLLYAPTGGTVVNVTGDPIWAKDNEIDGLNAAWSNQVPKNLVKGTSGANCHALILGAFASMINGLWGSGFEMVVDPYRLKKQGLIEVTTFIMTDWALRYPQGFVVAQDCLKS